MQNVVTPKAPLAYNKYRRDAYKLLAECYHLPDEGLVKTLSNLDTSGGGLFLDLAKHRPKTSDIDSLLLDYTKLFLGPYGALASPYGSIYLENMNRVMGNSTVDVRNRYAEEGLVINLKEAPDHIAIELEFMYFLVFKEIKATKNQGPGNSARYQHKQRAFLETHLGAWVSDFTSKVETNAQTGFYKNLARVTKSFVNSDLASGVTSI
jgi:TorA maturation chaperone TorD